ncbi:MAG: ATP-binding cassette domain-containing protein [Proteobacteria bacterium]|nr:ATP-binding cassette domain-containing protein [Pseudomonadota bacterium]MBU1640305.1 ATP-binding cassette domain-containing protein [Pseudomonadota bacterium]
MKPAIRFVDVVKKFGDQVVLDHVNVEFLAGKTTVIAGGSGQGKSVSLKLILGLMAPDSGQILVDGCDVGKLSRKELDQVRAKFGVLFQGSALLDSMTVWENVALPLRERTKIKDEELISRVEGALAQFDLTGHGDKFPAQLSGGMKKRVGLARATMLKPDIVLFDEPTTGLDPQITMDIYRLFFRTQKEFGFTSIIVSHDIPKVFNLADQVVILNDGTMTVFEHPEDIQHSEDPNIMEFVEQTMGDVYSSSEELE